MTQPRAADVSPTWRRESWRLFVEHNPLYLLSACCMLAGCWVLTTTWAPQPGRLGGLLALLGVLNLYEALLVGFGLFVVARLAEPRHGRTLLLLEMAFLLDATHLYAEAASDEGWGLLLGLAALALAVAKVEVVARGLGLVLPWGRLALVGGGLGAVLVLPGLLAALVRRGWPIEGLLYSSWWLLGLLVVVQSLAGGLGPGTDPVGVSPRRAFRRALDLLPAASFTLHLFAISWIYDVPFHLAHLAPLGLALSLCAVRSRPEWFPRTRLALPSICVVLTFAGDPDLPWETVLTPLGATALLAGLVHLHDFRRNGSVAAAWLAALYLVVGPGLRFWDAWTRLLEWLLPSTAEEWGRWGVASAFVLLGLGLLLSLRSGRRPAEG